jgi:hypothetical protein
MTRIAPAHVIVDFAAMCGSSTLSALDFPGMAAGVLAENNAAQQAVCKHDQ